jgi:hypothetical protein
MSTDEKSRVWVEWYGGTNYAMSYPWEYLETFPTLEAAKDALVDRYVSGHWLTQDFDYVNREPDSKLTPNVGEDSEMWLWYSDPIESPDESELLFRYPREHYPDAVIKLHITDDDTQALALAVVEPA